MEIRIRVALADDHPMVVDGIEGYFSSSEAIEVVGKTTNINEVLSLIKRTNPDVLLMDYHFCNEKITGLDVCKSLAAEQPSLKVIIVSSFSDITLIKDFLGAGAKGFMLKTSTRQEFIDAVLNVCAGGESFSRDVQDLLIKDRLIGSNQQSIRFTRTEKEILKLIIQGDSSDTIAKKLFRERTTIDTHRKSILAKFQLMDRDNPNPSKNISHYIAKFNIANRIDSM